MDAMNTAEAAAIFAKNIGLIGGIWGIAWGLRGLAESAANVALCRSTIEEDEEDEDEEAAE